MKKLIPIALILLCLALPAQAAQWELDAGHSSVMFETKHIFSAIRGQFTGIKAQMTFDPNQPTQGQIFFEVDTATINTLNTKRDQHLRSKDFFNTSRYPKMQFRSMAVIPLGNNNFQVKGRLTLKETTREMDVEMKFLGQAPNPFKPKQTVGGFEARFRINRLDFGVGTGKFYEMGVVDKDVEILISVEMFRAP